MSEQDWFTKDFYRELGIEKDADDAAIKKAYRKLARKYHPDQNPGDAAAEAKFKDISEAYTVLSDKQQRQKYDAMRQMAGGGARFAPGGSTGFEDLFGGMFGGGTTFSMNGQQFGGAGVEDLLGGLFGAGRGARAGFGAQDPFAGAQGFGGSGFGGQRPAPTSGVDLKSAVTLSFRQALKGTEIRLKVNGKTVNARIPAGVKDAQKIKLAGKGKPGTNGGKAGDLLITVTVTPHEVYRREGNDLRICVPVTLAEATHGCELDVPQLDGSTLTVQVPAGTTSGTTLRVAGRGVATAKTIGDLLVEVEIAIPSTVSETAAKAIATYTAETADFDPRATLVDQVSMA